MAEISSVESWILRLQESDRIFYQKINEIRAQMGMPPAKPPSYGNKKQDPEPVILHPEASGSRLQSMEENLKRMKALVLQSQQIADSIRSNSSRSFNYEGEQQPIDLISDSPANPPNFQSVEESVEDVLESPESICDSRETLNCDSGHSRFEVGGDARRPKTMEDKEIEISTQRVSAKSFQGNQEQLQEMSASIDFGLSPISRSGVDEIVESEPSAYRYQTPELPSFLMEDCPTIIEFPQKNHQSSETSKSSLNGNSTDLKVIPSSSLERIAFHIASAEVSEWFDASFDSIELGEADLKLNSIEFLVTILAHKVFEEMPSRKNGNEITVGVFLSTDVPNSFVFDPGKRISFLLHSGVIEALVIFFFDPGISCKV